MLEVISINLNGIRSAGRKGFFAWLRQQQADIVCVQEVRAQAAEVMDEAFSLAGYHTHFHYADKKGYSGVGIYSRFKPKQMVTGLGFASADQEGRYVAFEYEQFWVASLYMPSGTSGDERQAVKFDFLDRYADYLAEIKKHQKDFIICGDWNIAHKQIDLKNWRSNQKNSGFLPEERAWMDKLFGEYGFVDAFRLVNQASDQYTWWSNRGRAYEKNVGWRIDYQVITPSLADKVRAATIYKNERFSDHAPLIIQYDIHV